MTSKRVGIARAIWKLVGVATALVALPSLAACNRPTIPFPAKALGIDPASWGGVEDEDDDAIVDYDSARLELRAERDESGIQTTVSLRDAAGEPMVLPESFRLWSKRGDGVQSVFWDPQNFPSAYEPAMRWRFEADGPLSLWLSTEDLDDLVARTSIPAPFTVSEDGGAAPTVDAVRLLPIVSPDAELGTWRVSVAACPFDVGLDPHGKALAFVARAPASGLALTRCTFTLEHIDAGEVLSEKYSRDVVPDAVRGVVGFVGIERRTFTVTFAR